MSISIDESRWPLVLMRLEGSMLGPDIDKHFLVTTPRLYARGRFAVIVDTRDADLPKFDAAMREKLSNGLKRVRPLLLEKLICETYIVESALARGIVTAVWWIVPPVWPAVVCPDLSSALSWAEEQAARDATAQKGKAHPKPMGKPSADKSGSPE